MKHPQHRSSSGFTLIELMIAVSIVAILAAIAYPSYRNYVLRGQVVTATNALSALQANMERYFQDNRTYTTVNATTIYSPCTPPNPIVSGTFTLSCSAGPTATTYTLQAVGSGATAGFTYLVDNFNNQTTTITGVRGWQSCATGWAIKEGPC